MDKNRKKRVGTMAVVILSTFAVSAIGFTGARYYSRLKGVGNVEMGKFEVRIENDYSQVVLDGTGTMADGETRGYAFKIINNSDVAVCCDVTFTWNVSLPENLSLRIDGKETMVYDERTKFVFRDFHFDVGESQEHELIIFADYVKGENGDKHFEGSANVTVNAIQVEPRE